MFGIDSYNRPFITIKYFDETPKVLVLFQRYSDTKKIWTHGSSYYHKLLNDTNRFYDNKIIDKYIEENIFNLINKKNFIIYNKFVNFSKSDKVLVNNVYLID